MWEALAVSTGVVALGEMGDKTQLLAMVLAARYKRPAPIVAGILVATLANHALAGVLGQAVAALLGPAGLRWAIGGGFLAMALWMLKPDEVDAGDLGRSRWGVFGTTLVAFFLAEMGDKTQVATVALAARYAVLWAVVLGTTLGMMLANVPVVYLGERLTRRLPLRWLNAGAAALFALLGVLTLVGGELLFTAA